MNECEFCDDGWVNLNPVHTEDGDYWEEGNPCPECSPPTPTVAEMGGTFSGPDSVEWLREQRDREVPS